MQEYLYYIVDLNSDLSYDHILLYTDVIKIFRLCLKNYVLKQEVLIKKNYHQLELNK